MKSKVPIHPGEILSEDFMLPLGISINRLARDLHVPLNRIHAIVDGQRGITDTTCASPAGRPGPKLPA